MSISWSSVSGATSYNIYWSTTSGVTKTTGTKLTGVTSPYTHTGLTNGTTYYYVVTAVNSYGESSESSQVSGTPTSSTTLTLATLSADVTLSRIALDSNNVYFDENYSNGSRLKKVSKNGGSAITVFDFNASTISGTENYGLSEFIVSGSYIYGGIGGYTGHAIFKLPVDGGSLTILTNITGGSILGVIGGEVYFRHGFSTISKISVNGGAITNVASVGFVRSYDYDNTSIYYQVYDGKDYRRVDISSGTITNMITGNTTEFNIVVDSTNLYYNPGVGIKKLPKGGGSVTTLVSSGYPRISDDTYLYFVSTDSSTLMRIPVNGGAITTLATDYSIGGVEVDTSSIYWVVNPVSGESRRVMKMTKP